MKRRTVLKLLCGMPALPAVIVAAAELPVIHDGWSECYPEPAIVNAVDIELGMPDRMWGWLLCSDGRAYVSVDGELLEETGFTYGKDTVLTIAAEGRIVSFFKDGKLISRHTRVNRRADQESSSAAPTVVTSSAATPTGRLLGKDIEPEDA